MTDTTTDWLAKLTAAYGTISEFLARNDDLSASDLANMEKSPHRAAKAFMEMTETRTAIHSQVQEIIGTSFPLENNNKRGLAAMVTQGPISVQSLCPHHWLSVEYEVYVSYIPKVGGGVLGLSKLTRLCEALGKRPIIQEQLAADIADVLFRDDSHKAEARWPSIESEGSAVLLVGHHSCMSCRGVRSNALTGTPELRGVYWEPSMESKFYGQINMLKTSNLG